ncbi:MAG: hypothetical protein JNM10_04590, partial [Planctomycetia bacterium]|nr:hypothetical protein [Planctomycetia bacterium]
DNEFSDGHDFRGDLAAWVDAFGAGAAATSLDVRVGTTASSQWADARDAGALASVRADLAKASWTAPDTPRVVTASRWVERALARNDVPSSALVGAGRAAAVLVLIASEQLPEDTTARLREVVGRRDAWRSQLLPPGGSWDEEAVGARLAAAACPLFVVAPEVRFLDEMPLPTLPALPWASRPWARDPPRFEWIELDLFPPTPPLPGPDAPTTPYDGVPPRRHRVVREPRAGRFAAWTPLWFPRMPRTGRLAFPADSPSGYGYWPFARVAARSGGRYAFYPFPPAEFLDVCPADAHLLNELTPCLDARSRWPARVAADDATRALLEAQRMVLDVTPWADGVLREDGRGDAWAAFTQAKPPVAADRWVPRRFPWDDPIPDGADLRRLADAIRWGERIATTVLPRYEAALARLDAAVEAMGDGVGTPPPPRAQADLLLGRCWFAMSAFHLHALSIYLREIRTFLPPGTPAEPSELVVTYVPTIRLSDVLEGYEGRTMPAAFETSKQRPAPADIPRFQSNILDIEGRDPAYRALRSWDRVVERLDPRLLRDAVRVRATAAAVMRRFARSPHGWAAYYAELDTFVWSPGLGDRSRRILWGSPDLPPATTPSDGGGATTPDDDPVPTPPGGTPRPGSGSGGPTTK